MPRRLCTWPGCPDPVKYRGYCQRHARAKERGTNRAGRAIYATKRWKLLRRRKLFETPLCEAEGCGEIATDVHHRTDLADGGDPWKLANLQSLCHSHHSRETRAAQTGATA